MKFIVCLVFLTTAGFTSGQSTQEVRAHSGYTQDGQCSYTFVLPPSSVQQCGSGQGEAGLQQIREQARALKIAMKMMGELQNKYQELSDVLEQRLSALEGNTRNTTQSGQGVQQQWVHRYEEDGWEQSKQLPEVQPLSTSSAATGSKDKNGLPSSCTEVTERSGFNTDRFYVIDPDGPDRGVLPMAVQCDVEGGTAITLIGHNSEARTHVNGFAGPGSYSRNVTYWNSMGQMRVLIDQSSLCKQHIKYECYHSVIWYPGTTYAWWVTWDGRQADYWGGASPGSGKCACGQSGTCSKRCNCDANDGTWREDSGFLFHKDDLPVTQLRFGDTAGSAQGYHTLGKLICYP
ncbi:CNTNAP5 [Branchiostoma lanceolatum]|uniref:CNTNAP5 protein n=1 Tax=Branchiostoma lanceolatum TaxID=7740 RepID=A0A8J9YZC8_BRALA|nr:CNTNAP5 [Branchiostoma lanceolatum]